jgi:uncharacterized protein
MGKRLRLVFLGLSLATLIIVGKSSTGSFDFIITDFWFSAGLLLLILLSLLDQPFFSTDANVFVNGITAAVSLILIAPQTRDKLWWVFLFWALYLMVTSYLLMWIRSKNLAEEHWAVRVLTRFNRQIGRPESIFSALFLYGCIRQFGYGSKQFDALLLFWAIFMIINLPAIAQAIDKAFETRQIKNDIDAGSLTNIISPWIAEVTLPPSFVEAQPGTRVVLNTREKQTAASGYIIDDRIIKGRRVGIVAITNKGPMWSAIGDMQAGPINVVCSAKETELSAEFDPISVADTGSDVSDIIFHIHPDYGLQVGEVIWTQITNEKKAFYQVISGQVHEQNLGDSNASQTIKVTASQLGVWDKDKCRFEPVTWVAPPGRLVHRAKAISTQKHDLPEEQIIVGTVPNSDFPVHAGIEDLITHNTAIIGVTGSGKSYLAFHLIESFFKKNIKVLILDLSRQHYIYLNKLKPEALAKPANVEAWIKSESLVGIHQFAIGDSYPATTASFVEAAFSELSKTKLKAGMNEPARLCVVFEEAHSLIPEWNQVAQESDKANVNKTARTILQGRKYGMGCLIITQRTANVTKTILNQCNTLFALQSFDQTGLDFLRNYIGEKYAHTISTLPIRHSILVGKASSSTRPITFCIPNFDERWKDPEIPPE